MFKDKEIYHSKTIQALAGVLVLLIGDTVRDPSLIKIIAELLILAAMYFRAIATEKLKPLLK